MTLPQVNAGSQSRRDPSLELEPKRSSKGRLSEVDAFRRARREARRERQSRRAARRQRKLDALVRRMVELAHVRLGAMRWLERETRRLVQTRHRADVLRALASLPEMTIASPSRIMRSEHVDWSRFKRSLPQHDMSNAEPLTYDRFTLDGRPWPPEQSAPEVTPYETLKTALEQGRVHFPPAPPEFDPPVVKCID